MLNFQKLFEKSKYIHIGSCSVAKIPNNIVVQTESKTHLQFERKLKSKSQGKICHGTSLKPWFCYKPLKNRVFAGGHRKITSICSRTLKALIYSIQLGE